MAHVKVVRRSLRPEEWTKMRAGWLEKGVYKEKIEITDLMIRDAVQKTENEYEFDGDWRRLTKGDMYFTPDGTAFIRGHAKAPSHFKGENVYFSLKTAAEMIVKANGVYVGGVDPNRERILLSGYVDADEIEFDIEAYNRSKPDDERNTATLAVRGCRQVFEGAYLCTVDEDVLGLYYDLMLLMDIAECEYFNEDLRKFLFQELGRALDLVDFDAFTGAKEAAEYIEKHIYSNDDFRGSGDVCLVGHSHLDIAYYWRRIHAVQKNARTVLIQMRLMDRYPEFRYTHTQAYTYELLEKYYPELFSELKEKIAAGQFEPVGGMYVEPDCNVPACESLIRQLLYGQHYFKNAFGKICDNAWLPDVFGNSWILPQILKKAGVEYFVSNKMSTWNDTNRFPHNNFIWRGIDGSEVYACVPPTHFITWNMPSQIQGNWEAYQDKETGGATLSMYGYGDGGSGVTEEMLEMARRFEKVSAMPKTRIMGGSEFLRKNLKDNKNLETWDGELYLEMHRGTFTTKSEMKKVNRELEFKLRDMELLSSLGRLSGKAYPADEITGIWKKLLINHFHDILPGSHIHPVYEDAMRDFAEVNQRAERILSDFKGKTHFNTLNFERGEVAFIEDEDGKDMRLGKKGFWKKVHVPGLSGAEIHPDDGGSGWLKVALTDALIIDTPVYQAKMNADGSFVSLYDKALDREWVKNVGGFNKLHLYADNPGLYDAWDILPNYRDIEKELTVVAPLALAAKDGVSALFQAKIKSEKSTFLMLVRFFKESRLIDVELISDWNEKHKLLKVNFAPDIVTREIASDTSAGVIKREMTKNTSWQKARFEVCHHKWFDLSESGAGVAVINTGKYGVGLEDSEASLSLLRATERPDVTADLGRHDFAYAIFPHEGDYAKGNVNKTAFEYNVPLKKYDAAVPFFIRNAVCDSGLFLQSMKISEDGSMLILRLTETEGARGKIRFDRDVDILNLLEEKTYTNSVIAYHPFEILTVGIDLKCI